MDACKEEETKEYLRFSQRLKISDAAFNWCFKNGISIGAFNVVTALDELGIMDTKKVIAWCQDNDKQKEEKKLKKFWIVIGETGVKIPERKPLENITHGDGEERLSDVVDFGTELQAIKVAERVAVKHPGETFYIMESVKCSKAEMKAQTSG